MPEEKVSVHLPRATVEWWANHDPAPVMQARVIDTIEACIKSLHAPAPDEPNPEAPIVAAARAWGAAYVALAEADRSRYSKPDPYYDARDAANAARLALLAALGTEGDA